jgi:L-ascorbate metabolism protein UlaG (beta-lactamase superfamily)
MKITKFAQSNFLIETDGKRVLIDPGIFNREIFGKTKDFFNDIDVIIVTHKHEDHFDVDSVVSIFMSSHPAIFSTAKGSVKSE